MSSTSEYSSAPASATTNGDYYPPPTFSPSFQSSLIDQQSHYAATAQPAGLPSRYIIRPLTHQDIPGAAHLLAHAFEEDNELARSLGSPAHAGVHEYTIKLQYLIQDRLTFVCEDTQYEQYRQSEHLYNDCDCESKCGQPGLAHSPICAIALTHDCYSNWLSLPYPPPEDEKHKAVGPLFAALALSPVEDPLFIPEPVYSSHQVPYNPVNAAGRPPGVLIKLLYLAVPNYYYNRGLAKSLSLFMYNFLLTCPLLAHYEYMSLEATAAATERIWTGAIPGRVLRSLNVSEWEYTKADGSKQVMFPDVKFRFKAIAADLTKRKNSKERQEQGLEQIFEYKVRQQ